MVPLETKLKCSVDWLEIHPKLAFGWCFLWNILYEIIFISLVFRLPLETFMGSIHVIF